MASSTKGLPQSSKLLRIKESVVHPVIKWGLETYGILPYCWTHWTEFYPSLCQLEEDHQGRLQGLEMKYGIWVPDDELLAAHAGYLPQFR